MQHPDERNEGFAKETEHLACRANEGDGIEAHPGEERDAHRLAPCSFPFRHGEGKVEKTRYPLGQAMPVGFDITML